MWKPQYRQRDLKNHTALGEEIAFRLKFLVDRSDELPAKSIVHMACEGFAGF